MLQGAQKILYDFLKTTDVEGMSLREIARQTGLNHPQTVAYHLTKLSEKGFVRQSIDGRYECLQKPVEQVVAIRHYSYAQCGPDGLQNQTDDYHLIYLPTQQLGITGQEQFFAVTARGDSMEPEIMEDDIVLIQRTPFYTNDRVVYLIKNKALDIYYLKRVVHDGKKIVQLQSANYRKYPPVKVENPHDYEIVGIVRSVIRTKVGV